jgi:hypothetical protein
MNYRATIAGRIGVRGQLQYRRADGTIIKTVDLLGSSAVGGTQDVDADAEKHASVRRYQPQELVEPTLRVG